MGIDYLFTSGAKDPKHKTLTHSVVSYTITMSLLTLILISLTTSSPAIQTSKQLILSFLLLGYTAILFISRFIAERNIYLGQLTVYDMFWQCNVSLVLASLGALLGKNEIVTAAVVSVSLDQTLWWVDIFTYVVTKKFRVGVAKYLIWPGTSWIKIVTSSHHLWFIPTCAYLNDGLSYSSIPLSIVIVAFMGAFSRICIPFEIEHEDSLRYMNINCSYECWKDVKIGFLHIADRNFHLDKNFLLSFVWLNIVWNTGNIACFLLIKYLVSII